MSKDLSSEDLVRRTMHRRAVEAVIWGMPAVNYDLIYQAVVRDAKAGPNQIVYWSRLLDWKNQTLTPNPDTIYLMPFINTKDGPVVLEIPPADGGSITGSVDDAWQSALEDVGLAGVDKGQGGKYLILPPGYEEEVPDGFIPMPCDTYASFAILRSNLRIASDTHIAEAVTYGKRVKLYPLTQVDDPPPTKFVDASDVVFDSTIPYDLRFFESLDRIVQAEPWLSRDKAMIDTLKSIGIEKSRSFEPDAATKDVLSEAIQEAHIWLDAGYEAACSQSFNDGGHWALPASPELVKGMADFFADPDSYPIDTRGVTYSFGYTSLKHLGTGQFYLWSIADDDGEPFAGGNTYRLSVPANVPVTLYWSVTAYDRVTHALIRDQPWASRSSTSPGLQENPDGSVDIYFGPEPPNGAEANWIPTAPGKDFEALFRFYGPEKGLFEKTWKLPDIEQTPDP